MRGQSFAGEALGDIGAAGGSSAYLVGIGRCGVSSRSRHRGRGRDGADRHPARARTRPRDRDRARRRLRPGGTVPVPRHHRRQHHRRPVTILFGSLFAISIVEPAARARARRDHGRDRRRRCTARCCWSASAPSWLRLAASPCALVGAAYLLAMALAVALSALTIGAILSTALLVGPAATALRLTEPPAPCDPRRGGDRRRLHVARDPARLGQLLLAAVTTAGRSASSSSRWCCSCYLRVGAARARGGAPERRSRCSAASWSTPGSWRRWSRSSAARSASSSSCAARRSSPTRSPTARSPAPPAPAWSASRTLLGLGVFSLGGALGIGLLGRRGRHDVATALSLVFMLGLGALFLSFSVEYAAGVFSLLFGEVLGISDNEIWPTIALTARLPARAGDAVATVAAGLGAAGEAHAGSTRSGSSLRSCCSSRWRRR